MADLFSLSADQLTQSITAIGAFGTAAFGFVDATKAWNGGISNSGRVFLKRLIDTVAPVAADSGLPAGSALTNAEIYATILANWLNGMVLADQKSALKALIKLRLNPSTAPSLAEVTGVDPALLGTVAAKLVKGVELSTDPGKAADETRLTPAEMDVYGRFDLILSTLIDRAYERADQRYRNWAKVAAGFVAVVLALVLAAMTVGWKWDGGLYGRALLIGLLATPLAPVAKDLTSAVTAAAKAFKAS